MRRVCACTLVVGLAWPVTSAASPSHVVSPNLIVNGSFETPVVAAGGYQLYSNGQTFPGWTAVYKPGNIAIVSGSFKEGGFSFPAEAGSQWVDLTGTTNLRGTGVVQTVPTVPDATYQVSFYIGNVYDPGGPYGTSSAVNVYFLTDVSVTPPIPGFKNVLGRGVRRIVWERFSFTFIAKTSATKMWFENSDPPTDTLNGLDNVSVVRVG
jgi:hypothetical protein